MHTKLHIDLSKGVVDVEGDLELVREVYTDFKDQLLHVKHNIPAGEAGDSTGTKSPTSRKPKRRRVTKKKIRTTENGSGIDAKSPKLDKNLDTSGLPAFYGQFETKNHADRILVFLKFLTVQLEIASPNTDQVYTCYQTVNARVPTAFAQAFHDASGRRFGYIDYNSPTDIRITTKGENHFKLELKKIAE